MPHRVERAESQLCLPPRVSATAKAWGALASHAHGSASKGCIPGERLVGFLLGLYLMHERVVMVITFYQIICY